MCEVWFTMAARTCAPAQCGVYVSIHIETGAKVQRVPKYSRCAASPKLNICGVASGHMCMSLLWYGSGHESTHSSCPDNVSLCAVECVGWGLGA